MWRNGFNRRINQGSFLMSDFLKAVPFAGSLWHNVRTKRLKNRSADSTGGTHRPTHSSRWSPNPRLSPCLGKCKRRSKSKSFRYGTIHSIIQCISISKQTRIYVPRRAVKSSRWQLREAKDMLVGMAAHLLVPTSDKCFKQILQFCYLFIIFLFEPTSFCAYKIIEFRGARAKIETTLQKSKHNRTLCTSFRIQPISNACKCPKMFTQSGTTYVSIGS